MVGAGDGAVDSAADAAQRTPRSPTEDLDLVPRRPGRAWTWTVRAVVLVWALGVAALWLWQVTVDGPRPWYLQELGIPTGALLGFASGRLWLWAGQPRLTGEQQHAVTAALGDAERVERRALARAVRRGGPPPAELAGWAVPYAQTQHNLIPSACTLWLLSSTMLITPAGEPRLSVSAGVELIIAAVTVIVAGAVLWWSGRARRAAARWSDTAPDTVPGVEAGTAQR